MKWYNTIQAREVKGPLSPAVHDTTSEWCCKEEENSGRNAGKWSVTVDNHCNIQLLKEITNDPE